MCPQSMVGHQTEPAPRLRGDPGRPWRAAPARQYQTLLRIFAFASWEDVEAATRLVERAAVSRPAAG